MNPASYVIKTLGGVRATARILNRAPSTVHRWKKSRAGQIPSSIQSKILEIARRRGLPITAEDLIRGRR